MRNLIILPVFLFLVGCSFRNDSKLKMKLSTAEITANIVNKKFGGVGFDVFDHMHKPTHWQYEQIFAKRWRELNPSFARVPDDCTWDSRKIDEVSWFLDVLKETNTEIYITTFSNNCLKKNQNEKEYVIHEVDNLEYLKKNKGFDRIKYYCMGVYRSEKPEVEISPRRQIASTISNQFIDLSVHDMPKYYYRVIAVDQSGNSGKQE